LSLGDRGHVRVVVEDAGFVKRRSLAGAARELREGGDERLRSEVEGLLDRFAVAEPEVLAWLPDEERARRLHAEAAQLSAKWPHPDGRPALYGIAAGIKDIFHAGGFLTRAGSALPPEALTGTEGDAVRRLRAAGALLAGKTVTAEFACAEPGPTHNPHRLGHTPGGSSSGSAAAVASGTCLVALGTQTVGSVIRPAAFCGVVGVKPSFDRIPTTGLLYFSRSADHVGYFTQDVPGARLVAPVLYDDWCEDRALADGKRLPTIGVPSGLYLSQATTCALDTFRLQLDALTAAGYRVLEAPAMEEIAAINYRHRRMTAAEFAMEHAELFSRYEACYRPRTAAVIREGMTIGQSELDAARAGRLGLREALHGAMSRYGVDLWACPPATGTAPHGLDSTGDPIMNLPWTHAGLPAITVPAGSSAEGLPYGFGLVARFGHDEALLAWAEGVADVLTRPKLKG